MLSLGLSIACGIVLQSLCPVNTADPMLRLIALERPAIFDGLVWSYNLFLYSTPFLAISILFPLVYVHCPSLGGLKPSPSGDGFSKRTAG
jgi:hypothetical protein